MKNNKIKKILLFVLSLYLLFNISLVNGNLSNNERISVVKQKIISKNNIKKEKNGEKIVIQIDKIVNNSDKDKLEDILNKIISIDSSNTKFEKYKDIFAFLETSILLKLDSIEKSEINDIFGDILNDDGEEVLNDDTKKEKEFLEAYNKGIKEFDKGNYKNAIKYLYIAGDFVYADSYNEYIDIITDNIAYANMYLGIEEYEKGNYQKSIDYYYRVDYNGFKERSILYYNLGLSLYYNGETIDALDYFEKALKNTRKYSEKSKINEMIDLINQNINLEIVDNIYDEGLAYYKKGNYKKAISTLEELVESTNEEDLIFIEDSIYEILSDSYFELGINYSANNQFQKSIEYFYMALNYNYSDHGKLYYEFGFSYYALGNHEEALSNLEHALKNTKSYSLKKDINYLIDIIDNELYNSENGDLDDELIVNYEIGVSEYIDGNYKEAIDSLEYALEQLLAPSYDSYIDSIKYYLAYSYFNSGYHDYYENGYYSNSRDYYDIALDLGYENYSSYYFYMGLSYYKDGYSDEYVLDFLHTALEYTNENDYLYDSILDWIIYIQD